MSENERKQARQLRKLGPTVQMVIALILYINIVFSFNAKEPNYNEAILHSLWVIIIILNAIFSKMGGER